jgi:hypothetical protein
VHFAPDLDTSTLLLLLLNCQAWRECCPGHFPAVVPCGVHQPVAGAKQPHFFAPDTTALLLLLLLLTLAGLV